MQYHSVATSDDVRQKAGTLPNYIILPTYCSSWATRRPRDAATQKTRYYLPDHRRGSLTRRCAFMVATENCGEEGFQHRIAATPLGGAWGRFNAARYTWAGHKVSRLAPLLRQAASAACA